MSHKIAEHTNHYIIKVQNGRLNFFFDNSNFCAEELCESALYTGLQQTYFQVIFEFALGKYVTSCYS